MNPFTVFIPARTDSTRLPRKLYEDVGGMSVIERTWRQTWRSKAATIVTATKDGEMSLHCLCFANVFETDGKERNGTEACAQAAVNLPDSHICINVQGDCPLIQPEAINALAEAMCNEPRPMMACLTVMLDPPDLDNPSICKVVMDDDNNALYFSRAPIPASKTGVPRYGWGHMGIYAYTAAGLKAYALMQPTYLEMVEGLEQNRPLFYGMKIKCVPWAGPRMPSVDTAEDLEKVREILQHP